MRFRLPLTGRLLLFNLLVMFLPIATLLFLDSYEDQLLSLQERSMVQQGRMLSAALRNQPLDQAVVIIKNMEQRTEARLRVLDSQGYLVVDSATQNSGNEYAQSDNSEEPWIEYIPDFPVREGASVEQAVRDSILYKGSSWIYRNYRRYFFPPVEMESGSYYSGKDQLLGEEVLAALDGRYGAVTRVSTGTQRSVNLYSAIPIFNDDNVSGVVLISQSTFKILENLYGIRLDILRIFVLSILFSLAISLLLSLQITRPIVTLSKQAEKVLDTSGQFIEHFKGFKRRDELGDLSRSLEELSRRLEKKILFIDSMTADLVHELKNPLASMASSLEIMQEEPHPLIPSIKTQLGRMDGLLNQLRELTQMEKEMDEEENEVVNLLEYLPFFQSLFPQFSSEYVEFQYGKGESFPIFFRGDRLTQVLVNLLDNALSFSPSHEKVLLEVNPLERTIRIIDRGPGIPEGNIERIFTRFFSDRKEKHNHSGLGLAIVHAIVTAYDTDLEYSPNPDGGSIFTLSFPKNKKIAI